MRIIFMGTPDIAVEALKQLIGSKHDVVAVVTQPDRPRGRGKKVTYSPVKEVAVENDILVLQPQKARDEEFIAEIRNLKPDLIVVEAFGQILTKELLDIPPKGCINIHVSLLPKYRGAAPINWSIINGEKETGVTIMYMDEGLDTGDIIEAKSFEIPYDMTAGMLHDEMSIQGAELMMKVIDDIESGKAQRTPQNHELHTYAPMMNKETGHLTFDDSALNQYNLMRGVDPWPGAWSNLEGKKIKIWNSEVQEKTYDKAPGTILKVDKEGILVSCREGSLLLTEIQTPGKRRMEVSEFIKGNKIAEGGIFE